MSRNRILVYGANGTLGRALLRAIGPDRVLSVSRYDQAPFAGYDHIQLSLQGGLPRCALERCCAVINAAGRISGSTADLHHANVQLPTTLAQAARNSGVQRFVQVSSFAVYGQAETIDLTTPEAPCTEYGRSKALGDHTLLQLASPDFLVETVRLPFLFSKDKPSLLQPLLAFARRARTLLVCEPEPLRSMLTYHDAAIVLVNAAAKAETGITLAADPQPFTFSLLSRIAREETGQRWHNFAIPEPLVGLMRIMAPGVARRLFQSSFLAAEANCAGNKPLGLEAAIRAIVRVTI